jgi:hypothetical protein
MTFTKLFSSITESTVWMEPDHVRLVWITMLAMADKRGRVFASIPGLANRARVALEATEQALNRFMEPDVYSRTADYDGRRIIPIDGGWMLLNYQKYREIRDSEERKEQVRNAVRRLRQKKSGMITVSHGNPLKAQAEAEAEAEAEADASQTKTEQAVPAGVTCAEKATPSTDCPPIPETLDVPKFRSAWAEYMAYRKRKKLRSLLPVSIAKQFAEMAEWGPDDAVQSINKTIANGWQGLFPLSPNDRKPGGKLQSPCLERPSVI